MCNTASTIAITSDYSLTGSGLAITTFATSRAATISFPHEETELEQHVHKRWSPHMIPVRTSPCNSALHANLRLLSFLLIISLSWLDIHSTTTVQGYCYNTRLLRPALTVSTNFRQPQVKWTFCLSSQTAISLILTSWKSPGFSSNNHCLSAALVIATTTVILPGVISPNSIANAKTYFRHL